VSDEGGPGARDEVTVVIVDDHSIFRSGLRADLGGGIRVLGEADDVDSAVAAVTALRPDVVLLDVHLPGGRERDGQSRDGQGRDGQGRDGQGGGGAEVVRRAAPDVPGTRFLALSVSDSAEDVVAVIRAGARGYITKGSSGADVTRAVHAVAGGDAVFSPRLAGFVLDAFGAASGEQAETSDELDRLTGREREVMRLIARGYSYKEVAAELFISVKTVETHVSAVLRKLQLSSRHELTAWALARRLL
jgi:DNA-binding NarL/FixJ family response regulator